MKILGIMGPAEYTKGGIVEAAGVYSDDSTALKLMSSNGEVEATLTVCLAPDGLKAEPGFVWLKGWSENTGIPEAMEEAGITKMTGESHFCGDPKYNSKAYYAKLLTNQGAHYEH